MMLSDMHMIVLRDIATKGEVDITKIGEARRQKIIDLGMHEPALVDVQGDMIAITAAGRAWLRQ